MSGKARGVKTVNLKNNLFQRLCKLMSNTAMSSDNDNDFNLPPVCHVPTLSVAADFRDKQLTKQGNYKGKNKNIIKRRPS